ncbi:MAG: hypothetical protein ACTSUT_11980, partial [Promethearchaeota archaeon]
EYEMSLKFCLNIFLEMFSKQIYSNYQNVDIFQNYNPVLHEILKVPPDKIEPSCLNCKRGLKRNCLFNKVQEKIRMSEKISGTRKIKTKNHYISS